MQITTLEQFYKEQETITGKRLHELLPPGINREVGILMCSILPKRWINTRKRM